MSPRVRLHTARDPLNCTETSAGGDDQPPSPIKRGIDCFFNIAGILGPMAPLTSYPVEVVDKGSP